MTEIKLPELLPMTVEECYRQTLHLFAPDDDSLFEIRTVSNLRLSGYFMNKQDCLSWLLGDDNQCWYITLNPVIKALYAREQHEQILSSRYTKGYRATKNKMSTTGDKEIERLRWILIDFDPERPTGISSTDAEKYEAYKRMLQGYEYIVKVLCLPDPIICDSGNGFHLLVSIDRPIDDAPVVEGFLKRLSNEFSDDVVKVDVTVSNPSRITKCYGTMTDKGCNFVNVAGLPDRPHRRSGFIYIPEKWKLKKVNT